MSPQACPSAGSGSTAAPRTRTSKWRCGPSASPVAPTRPSWKPVSTGSPTPNVDAREVRVQRPDACAVGDDDEAAPAAGEPAGVADPARGDSGDARHRTAQAGRGRRGNADHGDRSRRPPGRPTGGRARTGSVAAVRAARARLPARRRRRRQGRRNAESRAAPAECGRRRRRRATPDGKPCSASANWSWSTSAPRAPARSTREPSGRSRSARRVSGPTTPSTARPDRRCAARTARSVAGPGMPSSDPP